MPGVSGVQVNLLAGSMAVEYDENACDAQTIIKAVESGGYTAAVDDGRQTSAPAQSPHADEALKEMKTRIIVSAVFMLVLMYFSMGEMVGLPLPSYAAGMDGMFNLALTELLLTLPIVIINRKYYINGFKTLLHRALEDMEKGMGAYHAVADEDALEFLAEFKQTDGKVSLGKHVVVIGGGNTAMDTARAAKRNAGVEHVYLIYRRTRRYMPADEEELVMALEDGVEFKELLSPVKLENGQLFCKVMQLSDYDVSGRRGVTETGETVWVPADTVIAAVGEKVPTDWYQANGLAVSEKGRLYVDEKTLKTSDDNVYAAGDGLYGPATVVEAIRDGRKVAEAIAGEVLARDFDKLAEEEKVYAKRGVLKEEQKETKEAGRCLGCSTICENCVEVCPNRANIAIQVPGMEKHQIIHVDYLCNECGNCKSFCPYSSAPYLDKFTLFETEADMENSKNQGFAVLDQETRRCKVRFFGKTFIWEPEKPAALPDGLGRMIETVCRDYSYLIR